MGKKVISRGYERDDMKLGEQRRRQIREYLEQSK